MNDFKSIFGLIFKQHFQRWLRYISKQKFKRNAVDPRKTWLVELHESTQKCVFFNSTYCSTTPPTAGWLHGCGATDTEQLSVWGPAIR